MFHNFNLNHIIVMLVPLVFAVTIHEVAHGYAALRMGDDTARLAGRLTLNPFKHLDWFGSLLLPALLKFSGSPIIFGYAKPVPVNFLNFRDYRKGTLLVASAGAAANLTLAVMSGAGFQALLKYGPIWYDSFIQPVGMDLLMMLGYSAIINSVLAVFNLIPIPPLDGSRILAMILPAPLRKQFFRFERLGMLFIIFLLFTNTLNRLISYFLDPLIKFSLGKDGLAFIFG